MQENSDSDQSGSKSLKSLKKNKKALMSSWQSKTKAIMQAMVSHDENSSLRFLKQPNRVQCKFEFSFTLAI